MEHSGYIQLSYNEKIFSEIDLPLVKNLANSEARVNIHKNAALASEEYNLISNENGIFIEASGRQGAYYALQTLRQIGSFDEKVCRVPFVEINDSPKYKHRGLSLDESRHFFGKKYIKKYIDEMFRLKLNVLHWHLSDDQGWRVEIKKYPRLTEVGSVRKYTQVGGACSNKIEKNEYGGFYTQNDVREIVAYAAERCVNIMPEIDVPAHSGAAIAAYPELACRDLKTEVFGYFSNHIPDKKSIEAWNRPICLGKQENINFILDVYDEIAGLFPYEYIHIGGDECGTAEWSKCPNCRKTMQENGFKNEKEFQSMLTNTLCRHLNGLGKRVVGWNEVLNNGNIDNNMVVQCWEDKRLPLVEKYAEGGGNIIMSNHRAFYFDMPYAINPLENTYSFLPKTYGINKEAEKNVLGVEGEVWTEWIPNTKKLEMQIHPRMEALAEVAWTNPGNRSFQDFQERYGNLKGVYNVVDINRASKKIYSIANGLKRLYYIYKFSHGNPDVEFMANEKLLKKEVAGNTANG